MGIAIRWVKAMFGFKKENDPSHCGDRKHKIQSCIGRSRRDSINSPPETPPEPIYNNNSNDQNKRAIAVAAATAAAANAAVAAAQAAVAFARLTSQNRFTTAADARKNSAAIKIQALFRGYLARKALKALKSLVKLQALARGFLVRKEAAETLQGMEALFRAQSRVSAHKLSLQDDKFHSRRSIKRANEGESRRISTYLQVPIDGRLHPVKVGSKEPKSRLTRASTWARDLDSDAQSPFFTNPYHISMLDLPNHHEFEPHYSTARNTPRFTYSCGSNRYGPIYDEISKDDSFASHPGYMANTKSFRAKVRSQSAPKQRPDYDLGFKKWVALNEVECRPRIEKLKSPSLLEVNNFKNFVMGRIGKSS